MAYKGGKGGARLFPKRDRCAREYGVLLGFGAFFTLRRKSIDARSEIAFAHDVVAVEHRSRLVSGEAIALANQTPCDSKTLTRAARDYGSEITSADVWAAYAHTIKAAGNAGGDDTMRARIRALIDSAGAYGGFVASIIGRELGPS